MKRIAKIIALMMVLILSVQMLKLTAYAAPAPAVSSLRISRCYVDRSDSFVYVEVEVTGYGRNEIATYDNYNCQLVSFRTDGRPIVSRHYYLYKCRLAQVGMHTFVFRITSSNRPWNTMSGSWTIRVS